MDELKNEKENYKENRVINKKQTVNFIFWGSVP